MRILNSKLIKHDLFIFTVLVVILGGLVLIGFQNTSSENESNFCRPYQAQSGTNTVSVNVPNSGDYYIWINVESPIQISFYTLPDTYNPLLVGVDGNTCLKIGQGSNIALNTWTWVSSSKIALNKGDHIFTISGTTISYNQIKLIDSNCVPINDGTNCN